MLMTLHISQIRYQFSSVYFQRGLNLFKDHNVISVDVIEENHQEIKFITRVQGSGSNIYSQHIDLHMINNKLIGIYGDCTCPVGHNCKHVVAGCLAYHQQRFFTEKGRIDTKFSDWMIKTSCVVKTNLADDKLDNWFTFSLFNCYEEKQSFSSPSKNKGELEVIKHGYTAKGKLFKPKKIKVVTFLSNPTNLASNQTKFLVQLLGSCAGDSWYKQAVIFKNEIGHSVLSQLIKLNLAHYKNQEEPLRWSEEPYLLEMTYQKLQDSFNLALPIPDNHFLVLCEPPIIINFKENLAQTVKTPVSGRTLEQLFKIPKMTSIEQLDSVMELFMDENKSRQMSLPSLNIPLPKVKEFAVTILDEQPQPVLMFDNAKSFLFVVGFKYGDLLVYPDNQSGVSMVKVNNKRYELHYKPEVESKYLEQIEEYLLPLKGIYQVEHDGYYELGRNLSEEESIEKFAVFQAEVFPVLLAQGWILDFAKDDLISIHQVDNMAVESKPNNDWFELSFNMTLENEEISMLPVMRYLLSNYNSVDDLAKKIFVPVSDKQVIEFSKQQVSPIFETFLQLYGQESDLPDSIKIQPFDAHLIHGLSNQQIEWKGNKDSLELAKKLKDFKGIDRVEPPKGLQATLRDYQQFGLDWLKFLHEFKFNGILSDDMGLGKTIQTLTWILKLKETNQLKNPVLLIVPTSLIGNWKAESKRFTPDLTLLTLHGPDRFELFSEITKYDIIITTYPLIVRDIDRLNEQVFAYLVLDEAQKIKNPKTKLYQSLQALKSEHRLCLTGTPIENHLGELWSIFNFLMPGFLSNLPRFKKQYQNPIEKEGKSSVQKSLTEKVSPFLLRRTKKEVVTELPDKTEIIKVAEFEPDQANLYETIRLTMESKIRDVVAEKGIGKSQIMILDALLKLRQVCCDPRLVKIDSAKKVKNSAKLELLMDLVTELIEGGHKIILFSQFTSMLRIIEERFNKAKIKYSLLTGQTKKREQAIEKFKNGETSVFLISLKAGGVGLNLTEADTVIHYDPWWNPAVENQATDRAYRIGQNKEVFVYKLITANTIEEKIIALQAKKQALQDQVYNKKNQKNQASMTGKDLMSLLSDK